MELSGWVSAIAAVVSVAGAGFAWWWSNLSSKSKQEAERARAESEATLEAALKQAAALEVLAASIRRPPLSIEHDENKLFRLCNDTDTAVTVEQVVNATDFMAAPFPKVPFTMPPRGAVEMFVMSAWGHPAPAVLTVRTREHGELHVRLPTTG